LTAHIYFAGNAEGTTAFEGWTVDSISVYIFKSVAPHLKDDDLEAVMEFTKSEEFKGWIGSILSTRRGLHEH